MNTNCKFRKRGQDLLGELFLKVQAVGQPGVFGVAQSGVLGIAGLVGIAGVVRATPLILEALEDGQTRAPATKTDLSRMLGPDRPHGGIDLQRLV